MAAARGPRTPRTSRTPTARPRKVAGRAGAPAERAEVEPAEVEPAEVELVEVEPVEVEQVEVEPPELAEGPHAEPPPSEPVSLVKQRPDPDREANAGDEGGSVLADGRTTAVLVVGILVLALVAMLEAFYLWGPWDEDPVVSADRPVVTSRVAHRSAVDTAAESAVLIVSRSFETYDEQVEQATATMTDAFAEEYRATTTDIKDDFVAAETEVTVEVAAQSVVSASPSQVKALLFLNQFVAKQGAEGVYTPYRALVTVVKTDQGWLVADLETR